jgi:hypothetical protein
MNTKSKRDLAINQVPITTNPLLNELLHKSKLRRVTNREETLPEITRLGLARWMLPGHEAVRCEPVSEH